MNSNIIGAYLNADEASMPSTTESPNFVHVLAIICMIDFDAILEMTRKYGTFSRR